MPPFNKPKTLFARAKETISDLIVTKCKAIEDQYATSRKGNLTYDIPECSASVQLLHDALFDFIPPPMWNFVCEAALSTHDNLKFKIRDKRILYGVLINENLTNLKVRGEENQREQFGIEPFIPTLKNLVKLDLSKVNSADLLVAISNTCEKLEDITLCQCHTTSGDAFRCLVNKCSKLRVISISYGLQSKENLLLAVTSLPNLEYLKHLGVAEMLSKAKVLGPLKLTYLNEYDSTPRNVLAAVTLCPNLQELSLVSTPNDYSREIFDILTASNLKLKRLHISQFNLTNASAEKFFIAKGAYFNHLHVSMCDVTELLNFINFMGMTCKNLEKLSLFEICRPWRTDGEQYLYNVSENSLFDNLKEFSVRQAGDAGDSMSYNGALNDIDRKHTEMIALLIANSPSLEKICLEMWKWKRGYPSADEVEQIFFAERIKNVSQLYFACYEMPARIVRYFLANAPNLTHFTVPDEAEASVRALVKRFRIHAITKNLNIKFKMGNGYEDTDSEDESLEEEMSEEEFEDNYEVESDESFYFVDEDMESDSEDASSESENMEA